MHVIEVGKKWVFFFLCYNQTVTQLSDLEGNPMTSLKPSNEVVGQILQTEMEYFRKNGDRMQYVQSKKQGLFVGSGVIEAGCKTVIGQRLKQSGMQ